MRTCAVVMIPCRHGIAQGVDAHAWIENVVVALLDYHGRGPCAGNRAAAGNEAVGPYVVPCAVVLCPDRHGLTVAICRDGRTRGALIARLDQRRRAPTGGWSKALRPYAVHPGGVALRP